MEMSNPIAPTFAEAIREDLLAMLEFMDLRPPYSPEIEQFLRDVDLSQLITQERQSPASSSEIEQPLGDIDATSNLTLDSLEIEELLEGPDISERTTQELQDTASIPPENEQSLEEGGFMSEVARKECQSQTPLQRALCSPETGRSNSIDDAADSVEDASKSAEGRSISIDDIMAAAIREYENQRAREAKDHFLQTYSIRINAMKAGEDVAFLMYFLTHFAGRSYPPIRVKNLSVYLGATDLAWNRVQGRLEDVHWTSPECMLRVDVTMHELSKACRYHGLEIVNLELQFSNLHCFAFPCPTECWEANREAVRRFRRHLRGMVVKERCSVISYARKSHEESKRDVESFELCALAPPGKKVTPEMVPFIPEFVPRMATHECLCAS
ncbi:hypothetical protein BDY21DRAFT_399593 [Lineolata rhizophorae]|uniref:Uncharacterized protein n=1 Tax=Lineolata rhizophorae TaxID=578093 RepID=A0A6A6NRM3_9PEZI|nr:hypothetical protein BDY21DRAFT_399593 [Lineolata rhizophorae]